MVRSEDDEEELADLDAQRDKEEADHTENLAAVQKEIGVYIAENTIAVAVVLLDKDSNELQRTIVNAKAGDEFEIKVPTAEDFIRPIGT